MGISALVLLTGVAGVGQGGVPLTATKVPTTVVTGTLADTTVYTLAKPDPWNGTVRGTAQGNLQASWTYDNEGNVTGVTYPSWYSNGTVAGSNYTYARDNMACHQPTKSICSFYFFVSVTRQIGRYLYWPGLPL